MATLPDRIHQNKQVFGRLVSLDDQAALISAGFIEGRLDYSQIFREIYDLKRELESDGSVEVHLTGQPILTGWTFEFLPEIVLILALSLGDPADPARGLLPALLRRRDAVHRRGGLGDLGPRLHVAGRATSSSRWCS